MYLFPCHGPEASFALILGGVTGVLGHLFPTYAQDYWNGYLATLRYCLPTYACIFWLMRYPRIGPVPMVVILLLWQWKFMEWMVTTSPIWPVLAGVLLAVDAYRRWMTLELGAR